MEVDESGSKARSLQHNACNSDAERHAVVDFGPLIDKAHRNPVQERSNRGGNADEAQY